MQIVSLVADVASNHVRREHEEDRAVLPSLHGELILSSASRFSQISPRSASRRTRCLSPCPTGCPRLRGSPPPAEGQPRLFPALPEAVGAVLSDHGSGGAVAADGRAYQLHLVSEQPLLERWKLLFFTAVTIVIFSFVAVCRAAAAVVSLCR